MEKMPTTSEGKKWYQRLTRANLKGFFQGYFRYILHRFFPGRFMDFRTEQFYFRISRMNEGCLRKEECPCECSVPAKQMEDRSCDLGCYPPMMNKKDWEQFKKDINLNPLNTFKRAQDRLKQHGYPTKS
jgi:hypothetical protein